MYQVRAQFDDWIINDAENEKWKGRVDVEAEFNIDSYGKIHIFTAIVSMDTKVVNVQIPYAHETYTISQNEPAFKPAHGELAAIAEIATVMASYLIDTEAIVGKEPTP